MSKLLVNEHPILILPTLVQKVGLNEAIFLQQLHYWLKKSDHVYDGRRWVYNTFENWHKQLPFWSVRTIRRIVKKLEDQRLILTDNFNRMKIDRTKWYTIDYEVLDSLLQNEQATGQMFQVKNRMLPNVQANLTTPIPETTTENTQRNQEEDLPSMNPFTFFEQNGFGTIGGYIAEKIKYWCEDLSDELVVEAMKLAVEYGAKHWTYVESILRYWAEKGYQTIEEVHAARKEYKERLSRRTPPTSNLQLDTDYDMNAGEEDE
jgi:DnaD/phage-associated family protein